MPRPRAVVLPALAFVVVAVVALLAKSGAPTQHETRAAATAVRSGAVTVLVSNYMYMPDQVTVTPGTKITFTNHDATAHTATLSNGMTGTGTIAPHSSRSIRLTKPGTYHYHCVFHAFMTGTITVVAQCLVSRNCRCG